MHRTIITLTTLLVLGATPRADSQVLWASVGGGERGVHEIDFGGGVARQRFGKHSYLSVQMAPTNDRLLLGGLSGVDLLSIIPTRIMNLWGPAHDIAANQDDSYVVAAGRYLAYVRDGFPTHYTVAQASYVEAVCREGKTGQMVYGSRDGKLVRVSFDRVIFSPVLGERTLRSGLGRIRDIEWLPQQQCFVIARDEYPGLIGITSGGRQVFAAPVGAMHAVTVDQIHGHVYAGSPTGEIIQCDTSGAILQRRNFGSRYRFTGLESTRDNLLSVSARSPVTDVRVNLRNFATRGLRYWITLSLAPTPPARYSGNRTLNLARDTLFWTTYGVGPTGATGFRGQLDPLFGSASATFPMPVPPGTTVYVGAVLESPTHPGRVHPTNVWSVRF